MFGAFMPNKPMAAFVGEDTAGMLTLTISDYANVDTGTLQRWCLIFDSDGDGWLDCFDNYPETPNGDQADGDGDGVGDACTPPPAGQDNPCAPMSPMTMMMTPMMLLALRRRR